MADDKKIVMFPGCKIEDFPSPSDRIRSILFYGAAIMTRNDQTISPCVAHDFEEPVTWEKAIEILNKCISAGGVTSGRIANNAVFIPWPCAAVYFEFAEN